jgi:hypothetical protein
MQKHCTVADNPVIVTKNYRKGKQKLWDYCIED